MDVKKKLKLSKAIKKRNLERVEEWDARHKIRGVLVDVNTGRISDTTVDKNLEAYYEILNCRCIDIVSRTICGRNFDIICDDEAMLTENPIPSAVNQDGNIDLHGNLFIVRFNGVDDVESLTPADIDFILRNARPVVIQEGKKKSFRAINILRNVGYCRR